MGDVGGSIYLDNRVGSRELKQYLPANKVRMTRMRYADIKFSGLFGPGNEIIEIGMERKTISDLVASMESGRLMGHQLPGMARHYHVVYLIVEGVYQSSNAGVLQFRRGKKWVSQAHNSGAVMLPGVYGFLESISLLGNVHVRTTPGIRETCQLIHGAQMWWNKPHNSHRAHLEKNTVQVNMPHFTKPNLVARLAAELPGVGAKRAREVGKVFKTPQAMLKATRKQWEAVPGFGPGTAEKVFYSIRGK